MKYTLVKSLLPNRKTRAITSNIFKTYSSENNLIAIKNTINCGYCSTALKLIILIQPEPFLKKSIVNNILYVNYGNLIVPTILEYIGDKIINSSIEEAIIQLSTLINDADFHIAKTLENYIKNILIRFQEK